jgi:hypothetical protein
LFVTGLPVASQQLEVLAQRLEVGGVPLCIVILGQREQTAPLSRARGFRGTITGSGPVEERR